MEELTTNMEELTVNNSGYQPSTAPVGRLNSRRSLLKLVLLALPTLGIYPIIFFSGISEDINIIANRYDGKKTMHYCLMNFVIGNLTARIGMYVWNHRLSNRIGAELQRRGIGYSISAKDYWLWNVLGCLILVGPFVYWHKLATASNLLAEHYNYHG